MPERDDAELRGLSEHLLHEIRMLCGVTEFLASHALEPDAVPLVLHNAMLEDFTVHARVLIDFFWKDTSGWPEDAFAADFFEAGRWAAVRPPQARLLNQVPPRVGREIVHLTYRRIDIPAAARAWNYGQMTTEIGKAIRAFIEAVPEVRVIASFRDQAWRALPGHVRGRENFHRPPPSVPTQGLGPL